MLITDMPAYPFATWLNYREFSYEFDWKRAAEDPKAVVDFLLARPEAEVKAKRAALRHARHHFYYHDDVRRAGAVRSLLLDICSRPSEAASAGMVGIRVNDQLYQERLAGSSELRYQMQRQAAAS